VAKIVKKMITWKEISKKMTTCPEFAAGQSWLGLVRLVVDDGKRCKLTFNILTSDKGGTR
jgi:hypothetical protein